MALTLNLNRDEKVRRDPFTARECMNFMNNDEEPESVEEDPNVLSARIARELFNM